MCNYECLDFAKRFLTEADIKGKRILEIGSLDVNGSVRQIVLNLKPARYVGIDIVKGKGVDEICNILNIIKKYGSESFDVVISTELLEHVKYWRKGISNIKNIITPNGIILITTRSYGFEYHGWPYDFWRFEADDMKLIFSDFSIENLEKDYLSPGIFIKARKYKNFEEKDISKYALYSMIMNRRVLDISAIDIIFSFPRTFPSVIKPTIKQILPSSVKSIIKKYINKIE